MERRRISVPLAAATLLPIAALGWLGVRILQQDRDIERQRQRERLEVAAGRLALDIERRLQQTEEQLVAGKGIEFDPAGIKTPAGSFLLYQPEIPAGDPVPPAEFTGAEAAEFERRDLAEAAAVYRRLATTTRPETRTAALLGLGRVLRQRGDWAGALDAYTRLEALGATVIAEQPAGLPRREGTMRRVRREKERRQQKAGDALPRKMLSNARVIAKGERIRDVRRLGAQYGGRPSRWVKKGSPQFEVAGLRFEYHWYEHHGVGRFETKRVRVTEP